MDLKSLTYTSLARPDLDSDDLNAIHRIARELNSLDGITGLLVFNGTHFLQIVEGAAPAIDDLLARLRRDPRHFGLEVRDERTVEARSFPDCRWSWCGSKPIISRPGTPSATGFREPWPRMSDTGCSR